MEDVVYRGRRVRPGVLPLPDGGFGAKVLIWPAAGMPGWTRMRTFTGTWQTGTDAIRHAIDMGRHLIDAESE